MFKKVILLYDKNVHRYFIPDITFITNNSNLYHLNLALDPLEDGWVKCEEIKRKGIVEIFSMNLIKEDLIIRIEDEQKAIRRLEQYDEYYDKRWQEIPKIEMSIPDWHALQEKWKKIKQEKPTYVIFELDDSGPLDKVNVYGKQELTQEDLAYIEKEHKKYLKYEKARETYIKNHPDYSDVWRGPQDDEYEADIMQYYDDSDES